MDSHSIASYRILTDDFLGRRSGLALQLLIEFLQLLLDLLLLQILLLRLLLRDQWLTLRIGHRSGAVVMCAMGVLNGKAGKTRLLLLVVVASAAH